MHGNKSSKTRTPVLRNKDEEVVPNTITTRMSMRLFLLQLDGLGMH